MKQKQFFRFDYLRHFLVMVVVLGLGGTTLNSIARGGSTTSTTFIYLPLVTKYSGVFGQSFQYGRHYPNGIAAVDYIYGSEGMWKELYPAEYIWNFYDKCASQNHLSDRNQLIAKADGTRFFTAGDADCHLLLDWNHDGEIDTTQGGYAFHEHNGKGVNGQSTTTTPFTTFWYDDNWLARYMAESYSRPTPNGLSNYSDKTRWKILSGDYSFWSPYAESDFIDQIALNGVYYLSLHDIGNALKNWDRILELSEFTYDVENQRYTYPKICESYQTGLFEILTGLLLDNPFIASSKRQELLGHWAALRSNILSNQERSSTTLLGWRSEFNNTDTLINTESIAANVLGLGAGAIDVFEAGKAPLQMSGGNYFSRPHNVLSAVQGLSTPGYLTLGPFQTYPADTYQVDFLLRAPSPDGTMATIDVYDFHNNQVLATQDVLASGMTVENGWTRITLTVTVANPGSRLEFRTYWYGTANMDIAAIRVRKP